MPVKRNEEDPWLTERPFFSDETGGEGPPGGACCISRSRTRQRRP